MSNAELDRAAALIVQHAHQPLGATEGLEFPTLREAIRAALRALREPGAQPSIVAADGLVLGPRWLRERAPALGFAV